jgi:hypothetical protein
MTANLAAECFALDLPGKPARIVGWQDDLGWWILREGWAKHLGD